MLNEIDGALKRLLLVNLKRETGIPDSVEVRVGSPPEEMGEGAWLNLFLHDVQENLELRDQSFEVRPQPDMWTVGKSRRATRVDVSYLLTAHAEDSETEHLLLGVALGILLRNGYVPAALLGEPLATFGDEAVRLLIAQRNEDSVRKAPTVWQAAGLRLRPSVSIVATAMFDPFETKTVSLVREAVFALAQGIHPEGAARQMDLRSLRVSIAGRVVDDGTGEPIANAVCALDDGPEVATDRRGVFLMRDAVPGNHRVRVTHRRYEEENFEAVAAPPLKGGALEPVEVRLKPRAGEPAPQGLRIEGDIRHEDGSPAAYIPVRLGGQTAVTDAEGHYVFRTAAPDDGEKIEVMVPERLNVTGA
ncbi:DUF4255 domain-containing protein [bacterium]|nr:MAG: DUF4255 domain-containing protein [bacterium]